MCCCSPDMLKVMVIAAPPFADPSTAAAIASAVNDALGPLGIAVNGLPIKLAQLGDMIAAAREAT